MISAVNHDLCMSKNSIYQLSDTLRSAFWGMRLGAILAAFYTLAFIMLLIGSFVFNGYNNHDTVLQSSLALGVAGISVMVCAVIGLFACSLAAGIGWITAALLALLLRFIGQRLTVVGATVLGVVLCLCIAYPFNRPFWTGNCSGLGCDVVFWYVIGLGIPSLIYTVAGGVLGFKCYTERDCFAADGSQ